MSNWKWINECRIEEIEKGIEYCIKDIDKFMLGTGKMIKKKR